jgi:hypothetical protein
MIPKKIKSFEEFEATLKEDEELQQKFKDDPVGALNHINHESPLTTDKWIYRIIVIGLSLTIFTIIIGILILVGRGDIKENADVPTILTALGSAAIGAVGGLLAPSPKMG